MTTGRCGFLGVLLGAFGLLLFALPIRAEIEFGGMTWYFSGDSGRMKLNDAGQIEWQPRGDDQLAVHFPAKKYAKKGDLIEIVLLMKCEGKTVGEPDDNIIKCAGTGDFRIGLFDTSGGKKVTADRFNGTEVFHDYRGYHVRVFPCVSSKARRWVQDSGESHVPGGFFKRVRTGGESLFSPTGKANKRMRKISGFDIPPGEFGKLTLKLMRSGDNQVEFTASMGEVSYRARDGREKSQPRKIDALVIQFPNSRPYSRIVFALPDGGQIVR